MSSSSSSMISERAIKEWRRSETNVTRYRVAGIGEIKSVISALPRLTGRERTSRASVVSIVRMPFDSRDSVPDLKIRERGPYTRGGPFNPRNEESENMKQRYELRISSRISAYGINIEVKDYARYFYSPRAP